MIGKLRMSSSGAPLRVLLLVTVAAIVCALSLRFHFPGYFDPFAVFHIDHFGYVGLQYEGHGAFVPYMLHYPRPFGYVLLHQVGRLGLEWLFAPVFAAYLLNVALLARYLERLTKRHVALPSFIIFAALVFANPEFYWGIKYDPLAVFSLTFCLGAAHAWQSYVETGRHTRLLLATILVVLATQTKESYFAVLALFWMFQLAVWPRHRKAAAALLLTSGLFMALALDRAAGWTGASGLAYEQRLDPTSLFRSFRALGAFLVVPSVAVALTALVVVGWWRDRTVFGIAVVGLVFAMASLLPNATLPNHLFNHYAALGLLFVLAPVLVADRLFPRRPAWAATAVALGLVTYAIAVAEQQPNIQGAAGWNRTQEQIGRRLVRTLAQMNDQSRPGDSVLVAGMMMPFNPFLAPAYVKGEMCGDCTWTVVVGSTVKPTRTSNVQLIRSSDDRILGTYDRLFVVASDGSLAGSYGGSRASVIRPPRTEAESSSPIRFFAAPNPAPALPSGVARTTIHWSMPVDRGAEVRVGAPNGTLLASGPSSGSAETGDWVQDGMVFFLQDASQRDPTAPDHTAAIVIVSIGAAEAGSAQR